MSREIKIGGKNEFTDDKTYRQIPVGTKYNGIEVVKQQTDLDEYEDDTQEEETKPGSVLKEYQKDVIENDIKKKLSENVLTPEEESSLKEKFIQEKTDEIMKQIEDLSKTYVPRENVDSTKKINDMDVIRAVAKLFGLDKYFVRVPPVKQEKEEYLNPLCEVKFEQGEQPPVYTEVTFEDIANELVELHKRKNNDYGDAAHQSYKEFGITSYVIRLNDKLNRLKALTKPGATMKVQDESIIDTLKDLAAYAIMAIESLSTWR